MCGLNSHFNYLALLTNRSIICILKSLFKNIILTFNIFAAALLFCSYLSQFIPPDKWWTPSLLGLIYPYLLLINLILIILWFLIKPRNSLLSVFVIVIGGGIFSRFVQFRDRHSEGVDFRLVSYNVKNFAGEGRNPSHELAEIIKGFLKENEPDIICLQEVKLRTNSVFNLEETKKEFSKIQHYQYARSSRTMGSVTMTRYPIVKMEEIRFKDSGNIAICTDIVKGKDTIRIFNVHLQSYKIDPDQYDIIESPGINEEKDIREIRELGSKYKKAMQMRALQARLIRKKIDDTPYPVIVCGDFNDTPSSYAYRKTRGPLRDAFVGSGKGIGQTYVGKLPSFRIDYILHSSALKSYNFKIHNVRYSDHLPVSCGLVLKK
jgi:endonuclease/exonuclease/phosphatase family metal-dependent hydrolase